MKTALIIPDLHVPYHSRQAWKIVTQIAKDIKPDEIVFLGDLCDFYAINSHGRHPMMFHTLKEEIESINKFLDKVDELSGSKVLIQGNHEFRLERFIYQNCPQLFDMTEIKSLLRLKERNWKFIPYGPKQIYSILNSKLKARHEPYGTSAKASCLKAGVSLVYGHIHRIEVAYNVHLSNYEQHVNFCPGWLGDLRFEEPFSYVKKHHDWQTGLAICYVDEKTRYFYHQIIPIMNDFTAIVNGKKYSLP